MSFIRCSACLLVYASPDPALLDGVTCDCGHRFSSTAPESYQRLTELLGNDNPEDAPEIARLMGNDVVPSREKKPIR